MRLGIDRPLFTLANYLDEVGVCQWIDSQPLASTGSETLGAVVSLRTKGGSALGARLQRAGDVHNAHVRVYGRRRECRERAPAYLAHHVVSDHCVTTLQCRLRLHGLQVLELHEVLTDLVASSQRS